MKKKILSAVLACAATMTFTTGAFAEDAVTTADDENIVAAVDDDASANDATSDDETSDEAPEEDVAMTVVKFTVDADGIGGADLNDLFLVVDDMRYKWSDVELVAIVGDGDINVGFAADAEKLGSDAFVFGETEVPEGYEQDEDGIKVELEIEVDESDIESGKKPCVVVFGKKLIELFDSTKPDGGEMRISAVEGEVEVVATVKMLDGAVGTPIITEEDNNSGSNNSEGTTTNPGTGIALAVAPAALAVAFVSVAAVVSKKKKG